MEAMFKEILNGNMAVVATLLVMIYRMHKEAMAKIDKLIEVTNKLATANEIHSKELEHGDKRFLKIEEELIQLRRVNHDFRNSLHEVRNKMVTQEHIKMIMETK